MPDVNAVCAPFWEHYPVLFDHHTRIYDPILLGGLRFSYLILLGIE